MPHFVCFRRLNLELQKSNLLSLLLLESLVALGLASLSFRVPFQFKHALFQALLLSL